VSTLSQYAQLVGIAVQFSRRQVSRLGDQLALGLPVGVDAEGQSVPLHHRLGRRRPRPRPAHLPPAMAIRPPRMRPQSIYDEQARRYPGSPSTPSRPRASAPSPSRRWGGLAAH